MLRDIEGVRLNVLDEGTGQAIVFLHGLGGCWRDWEPQVESWRTDHRVLVIEHRGHGRSDRVPGPYSTDQFAVDALAACRHLGVDHAYVVGLSMGGMIAQKMALADPGFVDALVLCDTFLRTGSAGVAGLRMAAGLVRAEGLGALATLMRSRPPRRSATTTRAGGRTRSPLRRRRLSCGAPTTSPCRSSWPSRWATRSAPRRWWCSRARDTSATSSGPRRGTC